MNIFFLHSSPVKAAQSMCDKHVVKMILESCQMLSTAHRVIDGTEYLEKTKNGRNIKRWKLKNKKMESALYKATHYNHPSAVWVRQSLANYSWLLVHTRELLKEYSLRYGKKHKCEEIIPFLENPPEGLKGDHCTPFVKAISEEIYPECIGISDPIKAYRLYYNLKNKRQFQMTWKNRKTPAWILPISA